VGREWYEGGWKMTVRSLMMIRIMIVVRKNEDFVDIGVLNVLQIAVHRDCDYFEQV
jgi:hypothetical protein